MQNARGEAPALIFDEATPFVDHRAKRDNP
jgi:hypothetical protein